jgi:hypothetical protein
MKLEVLIIGNWCASFSADCGSIREKGVPKMMDPTTRGLKALLLVVFAIMLCSTANAADNGQMYQGKTLNYWLNAIRDRNEELMPLAFEAIRALGPNARAAVPELIRVVEAPFAPVRVGTDCDDTIAEKLYDLEVRSEAIDSLAYIGAAAASATIPLIDWAFTIRVVPPQMNSIEENDRFIDLVTLEAEYRIGVMHAIQRFGKGGIATLARFVKSAEAEKRKFAVMTLGGEVLPVATELLTSRNCDDEELGIAILSDLEPMVAKLYLSQLRQAALCYAN